MNTTKGKKLMVKEARSAEELGIRKENGRFMISSLDVAEKFGKHHAHVLRDIEQLKINENLRRSNFGSTLQERPNPVKGARPITSKVVMMTRDGFMWLVLGWRDKKSQEIKEEYINVFNRLEQEYINSFEKLRKREEIFKEELKKLEESNKKFIDQYYPFAGDNSENDMDPRKIRLMLVYILLEHFGVIESLTFEAADIMCRGMYGFNYRMLYNEEVEMPCDNEIIWSLNRMIFRNWAVNGIGGEEPASERQLRLIRDLAWLCDCFNNRPEPVATELKDTYGLNLDLDNVMTNKHAFKLIHALYLIFISSWVRTNTVQHIRKDSQEQLSQIIRRYEIDNQNDLLENH